MWISNVKAHIGSFARREDGTVALEAMIVLPAMFWAFLTCFSIFDTFRMYSINQKAAYTIGDSISRETAPIDQDYLTGTREMFEYLANATGRTTVRVSSLVFDAEDERFFSDWSRVSGSYPQLTDADVADMTDQLPFIPDGERIMLVETWSTYEPIFATGLEERNIRNFVFTRPRFAPRVCWVECE